MFFGWNSKAKKAEIAKKKRRSIDALNGRLKKILQQQKTLKGRCQCIVELLLNVAHDFDYYKPYIKAFKRDLSPEECAEWDMKYTAFCRAYKDLLSLIAPKIVKKMKSCKQKN